MKITTVLAVSVVLTGAMLVANVAAAQSSDADAVAIAVQPLMTRNAYSLENAQPRLVLKMSSRIGAGQALQADWTQRSLRPSVQLEKVVVPVAGAVAK